MQLCGFNSFGQLEGLVSTGLNVEPVSIHRFVASNKTRVKYVAFAWNHVALVDIEGNVWLNGFVGSAIAKLTRLEDVPFCGIDIKQLANSREKLFCVTLDGQLWEYCYHKRDWRNLKSLLPFAEVDNVEVKVTKIAVGWTFVTVLTEDGRAYVLPNERLPVDSEMGLLVDLACGHEHGLLLTSSGRVLTWGTALRGQLGNDTVDSSVEPAEVQALAGVKIISISADGWHSCAVSADGDLYVWGWNKFGQLGHPRPADNMENAVSVSYLPIVVDWPLKEPPRVVSVYCGSGHTIALLGATCLTCSNKLG